MQLMLIVIIYMLYKIGHNACHIKIHDIRFILEQLLKMIGYLLSKELKLYDTDTILLRLLPVRFIILVSDVIIDGKKSTRGKQFLLRVHKTYN